MSSTNRWFSWKLAVVTVAAGLVWLGTARPVMADEPAADRTLIRPLGAAATANHFPTRKLGRGVSNIVFGVVDIPLSMISVNKEYGGAAGATWGTFRGIKRCIIREFVGVYEVCTFFFRQGTIVEPEFPFMPEERLEWRVSHPVEN